MMNYTAGSGHPCDFEDKEEREFSYLLDILLLIASALSISCTSANGVSSVGQRI